MNTVNTHSKSAGETRTIVVGFGDKLRPTSRPQNTGYRSAPYIATYACEELLTGTPTVAELSTSALTFSTPAVTDTDQEVNGRLVRRGQGVQFAVSGGTPGTSYRIRITATTDASPVQTITANVGLSVYA